MDSRDRDRARNARREQALERILPGALAGEAGGAGGVLPGGPCPDAEILAAFYERSLEAAEMSHWRAHFATCRRCQLSLTALAASDPRPLTEKEVERLGRLVADATVPRLAGEPPVRATPRKMKWPWFLDPRALAPMAAAAALVAAIGITIHTQRVARLLESQNQNLPQSAIVAENRAEPAAPAAPAPQILPQQPAESRGAASPATKKSSQTQIAAPPAAADRYAAGITAQREQLRSESESPAAAPPPRAEPAATPPPAPPPPEPAPAEAPERATAESGAAPAGSGGAVAGNAAGGPAAPAAPAPAESRSASSHVRREEGIVFEKNSEAPAVAAEDKLAAGNAPGSGYFTAASPDGQSQWRFGRRGLIEHTTNAGAAAADQIWTRQKSPLRVDLLAGSAPSATVCWIVGRAGAILRTTDGATWQVIPSPASAARDGIAPDWVSVSARDANSATITSADGRVFSTSDAGRTWQPQ
jgi:hypothetical protein